LSSFLASDVGIVLGVSQKNFWGQEFSMARWYWETVP